MKESKPNKEQPMKEIKIIVKENYELWGEDEETGEVLCHIVSSVGVRMLHNGEHIGNFVIFPKPKLEATDVAEAANELLCELLSSIEQQKEADDEGN